MLKNRKLSTSITVFISFVAAMCILILFIISDFNMSDAMRKSAESNMVTSLNAKTQIIDQYIGDAETVLSTFSKSGELRAFLKDPNNLELKDEAQKYNEDYYSQLNNWEGIYLDTWESEVITHSNKAAVGMVMREGDSLKSLQNGILEADGVYNVGVLKSPASGQLVISMYVPIMEGDKPIGFVGGATGVAGLKDILDASETAGLSNASYSLINVEKGVYIFDADESLLDTPIKDKSLLSVIDEIKKHGSDTGNFAYTGDDGNDYYSEYKSLPDRGWALVIRDKSSEIYASADTSKKVLGGACIIGFILIALFSWLVIKLNIKPLDKVLKAIENLKDFNLERNTSIQRYVGGKGEIGMLATSADSLTTTFREIMNTLNECSASLSGSSETMSLTSRDLLESIETNAATTEELSASIISTNNSIDAVTTEIEKMNDMVANIETSVKDGSSKSEKLIRTADAMSQMADETLDSNGEKIESTKKNIKLAIENLQSLNKINEMANQILDITSQTNLLSLNASIEAARAGEAGKGFAVVAGEIGSLADSSSKTATEIQNICEESDKSIESVRECFEDIIAFMEKDVSGKFKEFADMAKQYGEAVKDIRSAIGSIDKTSSLFVDSVSSIKEQVEHVNVASSDNEAGVEDIIIKNNMTTTTADAIINIAGDNQNNADAIKTIIEKFNNNN